MRWLIACLFLFSAVPLVFAQESQTSGLHQPVVPESEPVDETPAADKAKIPAAPSPPLPISAFSDTSDKPNDLNIVRLRALNKVTARTQTIEVTTDKAVTFGSLEIHLYHCWESAPEDHPENAALLEINEMKPGEPIQKIFSGWMFSSSPGLSSMQNPTYDLTVVACIDKTPQPAEKPATPSKSAVKNKK